MVQRKAQTVAHLLLPLGANAFFSVRNGYIIKEPTL